MKSKAGILSALFAIFSASLFLVAVGAVIYLPTYGTYIALALIFFGGFSMLMAAMISEKSKASMYQKLTESRREPEEEEEALL